MKKERVFLIFAIIGGLIALAIYAVPVAIASYNVTSTFKEFTVISKSEITAIKNIQTGADTGSTYYLYMQPSSSLYVEKEDYDLINPGDICNITFSKGQLTEHLSVRTSHVICNNTDIKNFKFIDAGVK